MQAIVRKRQYRKLIEPQRPGLISIIRGNVVDSQKINRWMGRNSVPDNVLYAPSPAACKLLFDRYSLVIKQLTY